MALENETEVIRRCQRGEQEAFAVVYNYYGVRLMSIAYRMLSNREEAEDALQDGLINAFRRIAQFRFEASFSSWLHRIVINACYDRLRRRQRQGIQTDIEETHSIGMSDQTELRRRLENAISTLPPRMKTCFVLSVQEGFRQQQIAEILDIKVSTVKLQVFEARGRLREALADIRSEGVN